MSRIVAADQIERIVGSRRHPTQHIGRAVSADEIVYILHSQQCRDTTPDLRTCPFSLALDDGIDVGQWVQDQPVELTVVDGWLVGAQQVQS